MYINELIIIRKYFRLWLWLKKKHVAIDQRKII